jgi:hypothetical protein
MLVLGAAKDREEEPQDINRLRGNYSVGDNPSESARLELSLFSGGENIEASRAASKYMKMTSSFLIHRPPTSLSPCQRTGAFWDTKEVFFFSDTT